MAGNGSDLLSVECRPVRDIGNAIGQSFDLEALRELGLVDDDGEVKEDITARQVITSDGKITIELPVSSD